ncbi:MAG: UvrD-helicase domain-containing protein [Phycisphaerae bacterium]
MTPTATQQRAIEHDGGDLLLSASAGSGKTEVLTRRCVRLICDARPRTSVDRLLVVTFTRAAAAELRERLVRELQKRAAAERSAAARDELRRQIALVDASDIGTIDAWCGRLVRANFAAADVDPGFAVLGEADATLLRNQVLDELLEEIYTGGTTLAETGRSLLNRCSWPNDRLLRDHITALSLFREQLVNPEEWLQSQRKDSTGDDAELRNRAQRRVAETLTRECDFQHRELSRIDRSQLDSKSQTAIRDYEDGLKGFLEALRDAGRVADVARRMSESKLKLPRKTESRPVGFRESWFNKRLERLADPDDVTQCIEHAAATADMARSILELEAAYHARLRAAKRRANAYEFADILRLALDVVSVHGAGQSRRPTILADAIRQRYDYILVDEYQDTSPVQVELLRIVSRQAPTPNRFLVGDVKQSIYGFRQAAPRLFTALEQEFAANPGVGAVERLVDNFRSHASLVQSLNELFAALIDRDFGGADYDSNERLTACRCDVANPGLDAAPRVELHLLPTQKSRLSSGDELVSDVEREGRIIAARIREMLQSRARIPERGDGDVPVLREMRLGDCVVLLRSARGRAALLAATLRAAGIPAVAVGRESVLESLEVGDLRNILALLVNSRQELPLAAYLRGPAAELSEPELLAIRRSAPRATFDQAVRLFPRRKVQSPLTAKLNDAMGALRRWRRAARETDVPGLLLQIERDIGLKAFARALPGGEHRVAMIESFQALVAELATRANPNLAELVEYVNRLDEHDASPAVAPSVGDGVVRIMTIHAAKGLEFPFVFLAGTGAAFNTQHSRAGLALDEELGLGMRTVDYERRAKLVSPSFMELRERRRSREREEELRLLYVAATRARERLFVVGHSRDIETVRSAMGPPIVPLMARASASSMLEWLVAAVSAGDADTRGLVRIERHCEPAEEPGTRLRLLPPPDSPPTNLPLDDAWVNEAITLIRSTPSSLTRTAAAISVSRLKELARRGVDGDATAARFSEFGNLRRPDFGVVAKDGIELGRAVHRFLQWVEMSALKPANKLDEQFERLVREERLTEAEAKLVPRDAMTWLAGEPIGRFLADNAARCRREQAFVARVDRADGEFQLLRGVVDCLVEAADGLTLLDYKTDRLELPRDIPRVAAYSEQVRLYAWAMQQILRRPVISAYLVFLLERRVEPVSVSNLGGGAPQIVGQLSLFDSPRASDTAIADTGPFPPNARESIFLPE